MEDWTLERSGKPLKILFFSKVVVVKSGTCDKCRLEVTGKFEQTALEMTAELSTVNQMQLHCDRSCCSITREVVPDTVELNTDGYFLIRPSPGTRFKAEDLEAIFTNGPNGLAVRNEAEFLIERSGSKVPMWRTYKKQGSCWVSVDHNLKMFTRGAYIAGVIYMTKTNQRTSSGVIRTCEPDVECEVGGRISVPTSILHGTLTCLDAMTKRNAGWTNNLLKYMTQRHGPELNLRQYIEPYLYAGHFVTNSDGSFTSCMSNEEMHKAGRHVKFNRYVKEVRAQS
jgi:hypothetical protein